MGTSSKTAQEQQKARVKEGQKERSQNQEMEGGRGKGEEVKGLTLFISSTSPCKVPPVVESSVCVCVCVCVCSLSEVCVVLVRCVRS